MTPLKPYLQALSDEQLDKANEQVFKALNRHANRHNWEEIDPETWAQMRKPMWQVASLICNEKNTRFGWTVQGY